jgi:Protein of unknown function (DUF3011)
MLNTRNGIQLGLLAVALLVIAPRSSAQTISCSSDDGRRQYCPADTRGGVQLAKQRSDSPCRQSYSWGFDRGGIWVDRGCRADFIVNAYQYGGPMGGGATTISCSSDDGGRHYCAVDTRGGVTLAQQRSESRCDQGYSWGWDGRGVWVDHGCRADFAVGSYQNGSWFQGDSNSSSFSCSSDDGRRHYCTVNGRVRVRLAQQRSESVCREGYSWGQDGRGVWVDHGCRADFVVEGRDWDHDRDRDHDYDRDHERDRGDADQIISCASDDMHRHYCAADTGGGVQLLKQRSDSSCRQGYSWGYDRRGIWVDHGCRADFQVVR